MRLSWNEIRARAADFAREWADAAYEKGETQSFYNEFFEIFGKRRRDVARYEERVQRLDNTSGFIDLFWPGVLLVEQKSAGRDLTAAREQAGTYFDALTERERPRFQLLCDFQTFELLDRDEREETRFALADLPQHVEKFGFIIGVQRRTFRDQDPVNIEASELIARLHDALKASGYEGHDLELFLVRTVFCLFADDTGIFEPRDIFLDFIEERTAADGSDLGPWLMRLFQVLDTAPNRRQAKLDEDLARFPHVNGDLFDGAVRIPDFDTEMRRALLDAGQFDWTAISPAIFGALFQSVMEPADRRAQGAHYTTEKNILKVIEPLFLDDLRGEFRRLQARRDGQAAANLRKFRDKLGSLRLFEGNHAVITPYLFDGGALGDPHLVVRKESEPINGMGRLITGTQPLEDGHLTFSADAKATFLEREPDAAPYFRLFPGAREFIRGLERWILHTAGIPPQVLRDLRETRDRLQRVRDFRARSKRQTTLRLADYPTAYGVTTVPDTPFLIVPQVSSERREYVPIGWLEPPIIPSEKLRLLPDATVADFALLTSAMHMAWMRAVTGRMKSDYMYSVGVVYNTFPLPPGFKGDDADLSGLERAAQAVLDARASHPDATLADLYDPDLMPASLRRAHHALDRAVDRLYRRKRFTSERDRVEYLFALYERMQAPLAAAAAKPKTRRRVP